MKICFLTQQIDDAGGIQRVVTLISSKFSENNDVQIGVISESMSAPYYDLPENIKIVLLKQCAKKRNLWGIFRKIAKYTNINLPTLLAKKAFYDQKRIKALEAFLNEEEFDYVISVAIDHSILLSLIDKKKLKNKNTKFIGWFHNTFDAYFHTKGKYAFGRKKLAKLTIKKLDNIITLTERDVTKYNEDFSVNCLCIPNPLSFSTHLKPQFKNKTLLFVGRLMEKAKGLDYLIEIAEAIFRDRSLQDWQLLIVGNGEDRSKLEKSIKKRKLDSNVFCIGSQKDVINYYLSSDILLLTSRWEGFGLVVTEAFECGIPVVSFHNDGPDAIIHDTVNGFLINQFNTVHFSDKVISIMKDTELKYRLSSNAKKRAEDFTVERVMHKWNEVIKQKQLK